MSRGNSAVELKVTTLQPVFTENAITILEKRYLQPGETPEGLLRRASFGNNDYYELMARLDFLPNSPTLFNAQLSGTLSACFKFDVQDTMDSIMDVARKAALVQKWGGGVGYVLSELRGKGEPVSSTHGKACGPIEVLKTFHRISDMITQGGKRDGAQMAIMSCEHPDLMEFIHCKDIDPQSLSTFNISVACNDNWMQDQIIKGKVSRDTTLWEMANSAWKTGDPGVYFNDISERSNPTPWLGKLTGTNPCGEVPLLDNEPCNLGSINLAQHVYSSFPNTYSINITKLEATTRLATRFLDDVLDHNWFPDQAITDASLCTRKLGLGVMGWADMLALMHIHYDTEEAVQLGERLMKSINEWALDESVKLAHEKGLPPCYEMLKVEEGYPTDNFIINTASFEASIKGVLPRNATRTCIAPTGTISLLAGASSGIEPHFALEWTRFMGDGTPLLERIPVLDRCGDFVPKTAMEIAPEWHIKHQAAFQKHTDLAVSKTINLANDATVEDIYNAYVMMWETGCKGGTIYRDGCRDFQVLNVNPNATYGTQQPEVSMVTTDPEVIHYALNGRRKLPEERPAINHKFRIGEHEGYVNVGLFEDGSPGEIFITMSKEGSTIRGLMDTIGILTSTCLQYGVPLDSITHKLQGVSFEPSGLTGNRLIPTATSPVDYIFHWMRHRFIPETLEGEPVAIPMGLLCPDCGSSVVMQEGCLHCTGASCGWSRCG